MTTHVERGAAPPPAGSRFPRPGTDRAVAATSLHQRSILVVGPRQALADHVRNATNYIPGTWEVVVASDGTLAGRLLGSRPIHAAVVGLEPALGGIAFLDWLRRHHPQVTRVAAFPNDNPDHNLRAANAAHVYVKPTTQERELGHLIGRTVGLQARLGTEKLIAFAGSLQRIPSVPRVYAELRSVMSNPDFDLEAVANVLHRDPGLVVKVLQVVNSAFYGLRQRISDLHHAVALMGSATISTLVLGISLHDQFAVLGAARRALDEEWHRALAVADAAKRIAEAEHVGSETVEEAYLAGLLHNVGRLVLASNLSDRFTAIEWPADRSELIAIERSAFGAGHPELGGLLLGTWGLDDALVEAVAFYAEPAKSFGTRFSPLTALHVAVGLSPGTKNFVDEAYLESLGLPVDRDHGHE